MAGDLSELSDLEEDPDDPLEISIIPNAVDQSSSEESDSEYRDEAIEQNLKSKYARPLQWKRKDFDPLDVSFEDKFPDPPDIELTPYEYVRQFIQPSMIQNLVNETNLYSVQKDCVSINTSVQEIEKMIGIYLKMGLVSMRRTKAYWEASTRFPPVADVMSKGRL
jgi:hypothetical protein